MKLSKINLKVLSNVIRKKKNKDDIVNKVIVVSFKSIELTNMTVSIKIEANEEHHLFDKLKHLNFENKYRLYLIPSKYQKSLIEYYDEMNDRADENDKLESLEEIELDD